VRAQQTARLLQQHLARCPAPQTVAWLGVDLGPEELIAQLSSLADEDFEDVWLVGHEPDFSSGIGMLLQTGCANLVIKKASLTRLEADFSREPSVKLLWSIPCSMMS